MTSTRLADAVARLRSVEAAGLGTVVQPATPQIVAPLREAVTRLERGTKRAKTNLRSLNTLEHARRVGDQRGSVRVEQVGRRTSRRVRPRCVRGSPTAHQGPARLAGDDPACDPRRRGERARALARSRFRSPAPRARRALSPRR